MAERVDELLDKLAYDTLSVTEQENWHATRTSAAFKRNERDLAYERAAVASQSFPGSSEIAYLLGQEHEYRGEPKEMIKAFRRVRATDLHGQYSLAMARYAYLWDMHDEALQFLQPLLNAYFELTIADDHFVYMRGLPFVPVTLSSAFCLMHLKNDNELALALLSRARESLTEWQGEDYLVPAELALEGDVSKVVACLHKRPHDSTDHQLDLPRMKRCAWEARLASSVKEADEILARVSLGEQALPWLDEIRLICKAEARHRFGDSGERSLVNQFFERQPLLFEPHHAFDHGFIEYQEVLKKEYQARRTRKSG